MHRLIATPARITGAGNKPIQIDEYFGHVRSDDAQVSFARLYCPPGWIEPGQTPAFDEYTLVLEGVLRVASRDSSIDVQAGQAIHVPKGEWVQYSTPATVGADYVAVCLPAYSLESAQRDSS